MVLQLAYYRYYGTWTPTYESASTRLFLGGRTETVRSCSIDSVAFVKGFESKTADVSSCIDKLCSSSSICKILTLCSKI